MCICLFVCLCIFHCHHRMLSLYSCNVFYLCTIQSIGACGLKRENLWRKCTECSSSSSLAGGRKHLFRPDLQQAVGADWNSSILCLDNFYQNFSQFHCYPMLYLAAKAIDNTKLCSVTNVPFPIPMSVCGSYKATKPTMYYSAVSSLSLAWANIALCLSLSNLWSLSLSLSLLTRKSECF